MGNQSAKTKRPFTDLYDSGKEIGFGTFSSVCKCRRKSDLSEFAVKMTNKQYLTPKELIGLKNEIQILKRISHPNVVKLIDVFDNGIKVSMVLELCNGSDLYDAVIFAKNSHFSEKKSAKILYYLCNALQYLHKNGIVHRDLKPENIIFLADGTPKITDFGLAYSHSNQCQDNMPMTVMHTCCGTPYYVAPEVINGDSYNYKCDMWSLGVILYIMLSGSQPFARDSLNQVYSCIISGKYQLKRGIWATVSKEAKDLIRCLLNVNVDQRYSAVEVKNHRWIAKYLQNM